MDHDRRYPIWRARDLFVILVLLVLGGVGLGLAGEGREADAWGETDSHDTPKDWSVPGVSETGPMDTATPTPTCLLSWGIVTSLNRNSLFGVAAVASDDVWAVGYYGGGQSLTLHWYGSQWTRFPSPNPGTNLHVLLGVDAVSSNDLWAVGYSYNTGEVERTLMEHWDGTQWSVVPSPNANADENELREVSVISSNNVWAVGYYVTVLGGFGYSRTLVEHWDGAQWIVVPSPNVGTDDNEFWSISAIASNDAWAVGYYRNTNAGQVQTLIEHWDGIQWNYFSSPNPTGSIRSTFRGVSAISSSDVWTVGVYQTGPGSGGTLVEHWDGTQWSIVPSPNAGPGYSELDDVSAMSSTDVWAVGYYCCSSNQSQTIVEHWDGIQWSIVPSPNAGSYVNQLEAVAAISSNDAWAVGYSADCLSCPNFTLTEHYASPSECLTPSPTSTPTLTSPNSPTRSPTATISATRTGTSTVTSTRTIRPTNTPSITPTATPTLTSKTSTPTFATTPTLCPLSFTDVHPTDYFYEAVRYLYCHNVISGYGDNTFRPYNFTTRGQLCKIEVLAEGFPIYTPPAPTFVDVPADYAFFPYVETAYHQGIVSGYGCGAGCLEFRPGSAVTRAQLCKIVVLGEGWPLYAPPVPTFRDVPATDPFYAYVETAYSHGIISGYGCGAGCLQFRPGNSATRGQICKIVFLAVTGP